MLHTVLKNAVVPIGDRPANSCTNDACAPLDGMTRSSLVSKLNLWINEDFNVCPQTSRASKGSWEEELSASIAPSKSKK